MTVSNAAGFTIDWMLKDAILQILTVLHLIRTLGLVMLKSMSIYNS